MMQSRKGSVLLLTLFLITLTSFAMTRFIEKAYAEILTEATFTQRDHLRMEAYSAMEATIAVLHNVQQIDGGLYDPTQGWGDPLSLAAIEAPPGMDVQVEFVDEMGKIPLPSADRQHLLRLFEVLGFEEIDSQDLTDALLGWMNEADASTSFSANHLDYERAVLPYEAPYRSLRSFQELAAIGVINEVFFNDGVPNELFYRFTSLVSLYDFDSINVNAATPAVLRIWSGVNEDQAATIEANVEQGQNLGERPYYQSVAEAEADFGVPLGGAYGVETHALRVVVTVSEGPSSFVLSAVVAPSGQAESLQPAPAPSDEEEISSRGRRSQRRRTSDRESAQATRDPDSADTEVEYPFAFLDVRENEPIL